jgi:PIN domain nuclease of toxin-antitoxin system
MNHRYWDSVTFLGWLAAEPDKAKCCRPVIEAAEGGTVRLVTSAITITEVVYLKGHDKLPASQALGLSSISLPPPAPPPKKE